MLNGCDIPYLKPGDRVALVAPASRCSDTQLAHTRALLESWDLCVQVSPALFGEDVLCAHTDAARLDDLSHVIANPDIKAIFCVRGGYGSMRLLPGLFALHKPQEPKLLVGMSDITALLIFFQQAWGWPVCHASVNPDHLDRASLRALQQLLFGVTPHDGLSLTPLNKQAIQAGMHEAILTGGNLTILQASIGTNWQVDTRGKILLIEETGERAYRVDRMLAHLSQAHILDAPCAMIFADFTGGAEPDGSCLIDDVILRFATQHTFPVLRLCGVGHGSANLPLLFGTTMRLHLGENPVIAYTQV